MPKLSASASQAPRAPGAAKIKASLELALLGLIAEQPLASGYDLVQTFRASMVHYWHAHAGQIYPTLDRMERLKWIQGREVIQHGRPNKRVYSITAQGRAKLLEWLESPFESIKLKHPPLLRSRFLGHLGADGAREKLAEARDTFAKYREQLREYEALFSRGYPDANGMFVYFTIRRGIAFAQAEIDFANWAIGEIDRNRDLFGEAPARDKRKRLARN